MTRWCSDKRGTPCARRILIKSFRRNLRDTYQDAIAKLALYDDRLGLYGLRRTIRGLGARRGIAALCILLILAPLALQAWLVYRYGSNVPITDEWAYIPFVRRLFEGGAWWELLYNQHNQNRYLIVRLVIAALAPLTHWNLVAQMYAQLIPTSLSVLGLWLVYRRLSHLPIWMFLPLPWLVVMLNQYGNYLFGLEIGFVFTVTGAIWACYFLQRPSLRGLLLAILCATFATYSSASGLMIWLAGFGQLLLQRVRWQWMVIWTAAGACVYALYFYNFQPGDGQGNISTGLAHPLALARFFVTVMGAPLGIDQQSVSLAVGVVLLVVVIAAVLQTARTRQLPAQSEASAWGLVLFALLVGALIALGRTSLGVEVALTSRYISLTVLAMVGIYLVYVSRSSRPSGVNWFAWSVVPLLFIGIAANQYVGWQNSVAWSRVYGRMTLFIVRTQDVSAPEILNGVQANESVKKRIEGGVPFLKNRNLSLFADPINWWLILPKVRGTNLKPILRNAPIAQQFTCPVETLYDVTVVIAKTNRNQNAPLSLTLSIPKTKQVLATRLVATDRLVNRDRVLLTLPTPFPCDNTTLRLELSSPNALPRTAVSAVAFPTMYRGTLTQQAKVIPDASLGMELNTHAFDIRDAK